MASTRTPPPPTTLGHLLVPFLPYGLVAAVHVISLAAGASAVAAPTKLLLMPLLAVGVAWTLRGAIARTPGILLLIALGLSWLGDSAGTFFPFAPTVPMMLLCFGLAHLAYIALFWGFLSRGPVPPWAVAYAVWWGALLAVLWPHLGALLLPVAIYGLVLGGTAIAASRAGVMIAVGGAFFLTSDSILAFDLFWPEAPTAVTGPLVMLTYTIGQGLIALGAVRALSSGAGKGRR
ncbi:lysoplasmalogenase family protein [Microbacterium sp. ET2]|uniref:lysoplasmalogenase family protein n=1 Tax=Microbacterium albipurpureum TaxID=3050384 RepID=UPI00259CA452|nr:lysoplasmalogenase family protein [Microbacterium sp. ET2 (Ac-2212)]WJL95350.1 lysoplasmalogenase family protein [Microbacterium sp. ET2 (Ac-2212)]